MSHNDIFVVRSRRNEDTFFIAQDWSEARKVAQEIAGKSYRCITLVTEHSRRYEEALRELGLEVDK